MKKYFKYICIFIISLCISGCIEINPVVQPIKSYEGHYYNANDAIQAIQTIELDEGESVWILSNSTLKRVLKNVK